MDIQTRKLNFIQEFLTIQNEEIVKAFEQLLRTKKHGGLHATQCRA